MDRAGNPRTVEHTFRRFQIWNPGTLTGTPSVPGCSSVPAVGQIGQLASDGGRRWAWQLAGSNRTVARIRSAPPDQIRLVGGPSAGGSTSQHRSRSRPTNGVVAEHSPSHCHLRFKPGTLEHSSDCSTGTLVPTRVFQTKSSRSGLKLTTRTFSA
eukprot:SAG11_NODE_519_length_8789_cov_17.198044_6_plen_155_part_00